MAAPPSPKEQQLPLPATVVMIPLGETMRTRELLLSAMYKLPDASTAKP